MKRASATILVLMSASLLFGLQAQANWTKYDSPEGRYSILFPGEPQLSTQESTSGTGQKFPQYLAASQESDDVLCMVGYFDIAPGMTFSFDSARDGMIAAVKGTLISEKPITLGPYPGRELRVSANGPDGNAYMVRARYYQVGSRIYVVQLIVVKSADGPATDAKGVKYFDSFQVAKPQ
jgi:hypothetical protein